MVLVASVSFGTTLLAVDVAQLSQSAELIVVGTVRSSTARFTLDGRRIVTDTQIDVREVLKGKPEGTKVVVMQAGGIVGAVGQRVEGTATFTVGEEVLVFLDRSGATRFEVTGMVQGKFRIERSSDGRAVYAIPEGAPATMLVDAARHETASALKPMPLQELKARISAAAQR